MLGECVGAPAFEAGRLIDLERLRVTSVLMYWARRPPLCTAKMSPSSLFLHSAEKLAHSNSRLYLRASWLVRAESAHGIQQQQSLELPAALDERNVAVDDRVILVELELLRKVSWVFWLHLGEQRQRNHSVMQQRYAVAISFRRTRKSIRFERRKRASPTLSH